MTSKKIKAIIIDDEQDARNLLSTLLLQNGDVSLAANLDSAIDAAKLIEKKKPDVLFLDVEMPGMSGFDLVNELERKNIFTPVIFTTAYDKYAIRAIKKSAFDYLLKPVNKKELSEAIRKLIKSLEVDKSIEYLDSENIRLNTRSGFFVIKKSEIIYCEADGNYTSIYLSYNRKETISLNLGKIEEMLQESNFRRIGRSCIINMNFLFKVDNANRICFLQHEAITYKLSIPNSVDWNS